MRHPGHPAGYYQSLVLNPGLAPTRFAVVIDRDISRTFGGMDLGDRQLEDLMTILRRVLYVVMSDHTHVQSLSTHCVWQFTFLLSFD